MSKEQLNAFLEKVQGDTSLQEKLNAPTTPEAVIEIAKDAGFAITAEDIQSMQSTTEEVSDDELASGGREATQLATGVTRVVILRSQRSRLASIACTDH